jgi:hypothetical protein
MNWNNIVIMIQTSLAHTIVKFIQNNKILNACAGLLVLTNYYAGAQQLPDGTIGSSAFISEIVKNSEDEKLVYFDSTSANNIYSFTIVPHIVRNVNGGTGIYNLQIQQCIANANKLFKPIGVRFIEGSVNYVSEYGYSFIQNDSFTVELLTKYNQPGVINLYLVDSIKINEALNYGFTFFPVDSTRNYIFLNKGYLSGNFLTTQLGHYMGLLSTHEFVGGLEFVDGTNCDHAGDYICDTYADPNILNLVTAECAYTGTFVDPNNEDYIPSVANVMSNSSDDCKCLFTRDQYRRMLYYVKNYRGK